MRILAIRGRNLASLADPFELDFDAPPLGRTGLFAITGPTGAGKSTLLDALCLALFDRIPRLPGGSGVAVGRAGDDPRLRTRSTDVRSILRRGAGSGWAEVDFVGSDRQRYRARWEVRRARERPDGRLQPQTLLLQELESGQVIGEGKTGTLACIRQRLGLSFEQFRRSVLLAQGDFAAFLRAGAGDRSSLLERITGTTLYSELSRAAFARAGEEEAALRHLRERLQEQSPLDAEQRAGLEREQARLQQQLERTERELQRLRERQRWQRELAALQQALAEAEARHAQATTGWQQAEEMRRELAAVEAAQPLRPLLQRVLELEAAVVEARRRRQREDRGREIATGLERRAQRARKVVQGLRSAMEEALERLQPLLQQARERAHRIEEGGQRVDRLAADAGAAAAAATNIEQYIENISQQIEKQEKLIHEYARLMAESPELESLAGRWEQWQEEWHRRSDRLRQRRLEERARLRQMEEELEQARATLAGVERRASALQERLQRVRDTLDRALEAGSDEQIGQLRRTLQPDVPCPVCGSREHPWAGRTAAGEGGQETLRRELQRLQQEQQGAVSEQEQGRRQVASLDARVEQQQRLLRQIEAECDDFVGSWIEPVAGLLPRAAVPEGGKTVGMAGAGGIDSGAEWTAHLARRVQAWRDWQQAREQAIAERERLAGQLGGRRLLLQERTALRDRLERELATQREALERLRERNRQLLGGLDVERIATSMASLMAAIRRRSEAMESVYQEARNRRSLAEQACSHWQALLAGREEELRQAAAALETALEELGSDRQTLAGQLSRDADWVTARRDQANRLRESLDRWQTLVSERQQRLQAHLHSGQQAQAAGTEEELDALETRGQALRRSLIELGARLGEDDRRRRRGEALRAELEQQQRRWRCWAEINELIGSHDGKKYRGFAQSLTLDALLGHANLQLRELTRRYLLQRVPGSDLEIQVIDRDMGDEVRSVHSLSGGESFIVSLALALGLASLSSDQVQVESLFIDEGFGTLDQETLDLTISALDALQSLGRQVGIISHVPALVERIGVRVVVERQGEGRGRVHLEVA